MTTYISPVLRSHDRARGMLLGAGIGDALGSAFETRTEVSDHVLREQEQAGHALTYSDDTALTMAVAEHLAEQAEEGGHVLNESALAARLASTWNAEPWRGYGKAVVELFRKITEGQSWKDGSVAQFGGQGSFGNGGAMRCAPVALVARSARHAAELGRRTAMVTHAHPDGQHGAAVQAASAYLALHAHPAEDVDPHAFLDRVSTAVHDDEWTQRLQAVGALLGARNSRHAAAELGNDVRATHSVPLALWAFLNHQHSSVQVVRECIRAGGDTDTIASMAAALVGAHRGTAAWPAGWVRRLEGHRRLQELGDQLGEHHERAMAL